MLEQNEGNVIQILYVGNNETEFELKGKIVGQSTLDNWVLIPGEDWLGYVLIITISLWGFVFVIDIVESILNKTVYKSGKSHTLLTKIKRIGDKYGWILSLVFVASILYIIFWTKLGRDWFMPF